MEITDEEKAQHYLSHIGYYRVSAYMYPLLSIPKEQHLFKQGVTFSKVMMLYRTEMTKEKGAKPMKIAYFFCSLKRNRQIFISRNLIPKNF